MTFAAHYVADHLVSVLFQQASFQEYIVTAYNQHRQTILIQASTTVNYESDDDDNDKKDDDDEDGRMVVGLLQRALEDAFVQIDLDLLRVMLHKGRFQMQSQNNHETKNPSTIATNIENNPEVTDDHDDWAVSYIDPELELLP